MADVKFKRAIEVLSDFEKKYHYGETVARRMATENLKFPTILNTLKEKLCKKGIQVTVASSKTNTDGVLISLAPSP